MAGRDHVPVWVGWRCGVGPASQLRLCPPVGPCGCAWLNQSSGRLSPSGCTRSAIHLQRGLSTWEPVAPRAALAV